MLGNIETVTVRECRDIRLQSIGPFEDFSKALDQGHGRNTPESRQ
jgi:hypothetical protein